VVTTYPQVKHCGQSYVDVGRLGCARAVAPNLKLDRLRDSRVRGPTFQTSRVGAGGLIGAAYLTAAHGRARE
jgi:hypothetical protein